MKPQMRDIARRMNRARWHAPLAAMGAALLAGAAGAQQEAQQNAQLNAQQNAQQSAWQEAPREPAATASEVGHSARAWLALQRSNAQAAPAQPMLGAEAGYAYDRYLNSFKTPIPTSFGSSVQSGAAGSGSGAGTAQTGGAY